MHKWFHRATTYAHDIYECCEGVLARLSCHTALLKSHQASLLKRIGSVIRDNMHSAENHMGKRRLRVVVNDESAARFASAVCVDPPVLNSIPLESVC